MFKLFVKKYIFSAIKPEFRNIIKLNYSMFNSNNYPKQNKILKEKIPH